MENSELQTQIINLGKLLVSELGMETSTDTLGRWMAHYLSEKIIAAEKASGSKKKTEEKECFELILKLWKHRWFQPSGKRPLENFEPILETIEKLDPDHPEPFFYRYIDEAPGNSDGKGAFEIANQIDRAARSWISSILHEAALEAKGKTTEAYVKNAKDLEDNEDTKAISILLDIDSTLSPENLKEKNFDLQYKKEKLKSRIKDLEKFEEINKFMLLRYKNELAALG